MSIHWGLDYKKYYYANELHKLVYISNKCVC